MIHELKPTLRRRSLLKGMGAAALATPFTSRLALAEDYNLRGYVQSTWRPAFEELVPRFLEANPGSRMRLNYASTDQLHTTARVQLSSGTAADVLSVWAGSGNPMGCQVLAEAGYLADLSGEPYSQNIPDAFRPAMSFQDSVYYYAPIVSMIGLYVNNEVRDEFGIEQPKTWSEFMAVCEKVKQAGKVPVSLGTGTGFITQLIPYALVATLVYGRDPSFPDKMQSGEATFAGSDGWVEAMEKYVEMLEKGYFNDNPNGTAVEEQLQMVATGEAAMTIVVSSQNASIFRFAGHQNFTVWPLPGSDDPEETNIPANPSAGFGVNANAEDVEGAKAFLQFLASPEIDTELSRIQALPSLNQVSATDRDPIFAEMLAKIDEGKSVPYMDTRWPNVRVQQTLFSGVQELLGGQASVNDMLSRMDEAYQSS
ncbi:ABC transporter substrate-binding protein [Pseudoruegeria sp. HB172150]|uniref:ABC transporter substrate-binding protein n=1 Tax=Pseudoruegeria sp. HB172150 TaxID=2721164 RepID=UPI0015552706|nr:extracellular solute-binding protein [Pseudoruegeria sp. HB172150]